MSIVDALLEWEETVYRGLKFAYERAVLHPRERRVTETQAALADRRHELLVLAAMLAGRQVPLFEANELVLTYRGRICLPKNIALAPSVADNAELYGVKTILGALAVRAGWSDSMPGSLRRLMDLYSGELPFLCERLDALEKHLAPADMWQWLGLPAGDGIVIEGREYALGESHQTEAAAQVTEIEGKGQMDVQVEPPKEDDGPGAELPLHTFEKVETLEEYSGQSRKSDDENEIEDHAEALKEVNMKRVIRSPERPRSIYRSDVVLDAEWGWGAGEGGSGIPYPEWDYRKSAYVPRWCFVDETRAGAASLDWAVSAMRRQASLIMMLKKQFAAYANAYLRQKRQTSGPDLDLDAVVENRTRIASGAAPSDSIYIEPRRRLHDVAALIVLDKSFSTDSYIGEARVLDTIADIVFCAGEVMDEFGVDFSVAGFSSNTRRACNFEVIKSFDENWQSSRGRLGNLRSDGYTRIGPAMRHGQRALLKRKADRKTIILITDGRPCDYDRYEGDYGVHDVRKAAEEAHKEGIVTYAYAVDKQAREHFHRMFPPHHYSVLSSPVSLVKDLCHLFARLKVGV